MIDKKYFETFGLPWIRHINEYLKPLDLKEQGYTNREARKALLDIRGMEQKWSPSEKHPWKKNKIHHRRIVVD